MKRERKRMSGNATVRKHSSTTQPNSTGKRAYDCKQNYKKKQTPKRINENENLRCSLSKRLEAKHL